MSPHLVSAPDQAGFKIIAGTARQMGLEVVE
jgi:ribosomal protein L11